MTRTIAVVSHKGGTGKTSLVQNAGAVLAAAGKRVLLVDFDPQSNLTTGCGLDPNEDRRTIYHALNEPQDTRSMIVSALSMSILPANLDLAYAEQQFAGHFDRNDKLRDALASVEAQYDYILIDTPPSLGFFAFNALVSSTDAIIPLQCHPYAYKMLHSTLRLIELVSKGNKELRLLAIALTMYDRRTTLTKIVEDTARSRYGDLVAKTVIPINVSIPEATLEGVSVSEYAPTSAGTRAYQELVKELFHVEEASKT
jgi:chromosome partitioning protein